MPRRTNNATNSLKTPPGVGISELLADAKRRYANARRRARFWSGNPSLSNFGPTGSNLTTCRMDEKYELAMCDCDSWENRIGELTGKEVKHYDPKQDFRRRFAALMSKSANAAICDGGDNKR